MREGPEKPPRAESLRPDPLPNPMTYEAMPEVPLVPDGDRRAVGDAIRLIDEGDTHRARLRRRAGILGVREIIGAHERALPQHAPFEPAGGEHIVLRRNIARGLAEGLLDDDP